VERLGREALEDLSASLASPQTGTNGAAVLSQLLRRLLTTKQGLADAELDLNLWAESVGDVALRKVCQRSFRTVEQAFVELLTRPELGGSSAANRGLAHVLHAAALGFEVQRALGL